MVSSIRSLMDFHPSSTWTTMLAAVDCGTPSKAFHTWFCTISSFSMNMLDIETASVAYRMLGMAMFLHIAEAAETLSRRVCLDLKLTFLQHFAFDSMASPFFCDVFHKDEYCWTPRKFTVSYMFYYFRVQCHIISYHEARDRGVQKLLDHMRGMPSQFLLGEGFSV